MVWRRMCNRKDLILFITTFLTRAVIEKCYWTLYGNEVGAGDERDLKGGRGREEVWEKVIDWKGRWKFEMEACDGDLSWKL
jgi:hypothetical protein